MSAEIRDGQATVSISDDALSFRGPIVDVKRLDEGYVGLTGGGGGWPFTFTALEIRASPELPMDQHLQRRLYDYQNTFRGSLTMKGIPQMEKAGYPAWEDYGRRKDILLDSYRPPALPFTGDWLLVLDATP